MRVSNASLLKNILSLTVSNGFAQAAGFIGNLIIARIITVELFALYNLSIYLSSLFAVIGLFGLKIVIIKRVAQKPEEFNSIFATSLILHTIFSLFACVGLAIYMLYVRDYPFVFFLLTGVLLLEMVYIEFFEGLVIGLERMELGAAVRIISRVLWLAFILILVNLKMQLSLLLVSLITSQLFLIILGFVILNKKRYFSLEMMKVSKKLARNVLSAAFPFFLASIFSILTTTFGRVLLSIYSSTAEVGYFSIVDRIYTPFSIIVISIWSSTFPVFSRYYTLGKEQHDKFYLKAFRGQLLFFLPLCLLISMNSKTILRIGFGEKYVPAAPVLSLFIWYLILYFIYLLIHNVLASAGKQKMILYLTALSSLIYNIFFFILQRQKGAYGLALAYIIGGLITIPIHFYILKEYVSIKETIKIAFNYSIILFILVFPILIKILRPTIYYSFLAVILYFIGLNLLHLVENEKKWVIGMTKKYFPIYTNSK